MERVFTLAEASALLPQLTELLTRLRDAHEDLEESAPAEGERIASGNGSAAAASAVSQAEQGYVSLLREVDALGVIVRDPSSGLVDFAATRDEEPVYLCWRLGETAITHWHPRDTGFAGRQEL
ncbi:MAG TPA: DUF2203 domain-containing protein [Candidatus Dormibacteraeota bacterium]|nr:DUF2203 domain-containing protein [Candidatus Dormibacteraeota bacterium]